MTQLGTVEEFYNNIKDQYTEFILRCVPRYAEKQWAILHYIPENLHPQKIIDLGCGVGNLTDLLIRKYPNAKIYIVDISKKMIDHCIEKYQKNPNVIPVCKDFRHLEFSPQTIDLVVSSISIHHITDNDKVALFKGLFDILNPDGVFIYSDQFSAPSEENYLKNIRNWEKESLKKGATEAEWEMWMDHQKNHDYHATLISQLGWLEQAGFNQLDCVWRHLLWSVVTGTKP